MSNPQVVVDFIANTTGLAGGFKDAGAKSDTFGSKVKSLGKTAVLAAGAAGLAALGATLKVGIDELTESSKVGAQTAAVIKSTGGAAGVTAKQVGNLANAMLKKTGIDDETIQSGENLLLTFTKVQNKAGKGNDIFTQATKTMLDMSVALGQDTSSSAIQLGKALNDPIKGITALSRVGVSFTAAQKDQIKAMVAAGDTMGAQKLILKELNREFGGSAVAAGKTLPGQINILKESFNNLAGDLVKTLVPALASVTKFLVEHPALFKAMVIGVLALAAAMVILNVALAVTAAVTAGIAAPIGIAIAAIAAMIAVGVLLYKNWDTVKRAATTGWNAIKAAIITPLNAIKAAVTTTVDAVKSTFNGLITWFATAGTAIKKALNVIKALFNLLHEGAQNAVEGVKDTIRSIWTWLSDVAGGGLSRALNTFSNMFNLVKQGAQAAVQGVKDAINSVIGWIWDRISAVGRAASAIASAIKRPINALIGAWNSISFTVPKISIPSVKILGKKIGGGSFGGQTIGFPHVNYLAAGGVIDQPTLAMVGEGQGREIVTPETLLRQMLAESRPEVRVFIGDTELRGIVKTEYVNATNGLARSLLAGAG